jgi:LmbE family N-acetylglucosaminyl deacetylase
MKITQALLIVFCCLIVPCAKSQTFAFDARYKADILVVVAHPDDDTAVSSYLARAVFDQHKKVAIVYCTRGDAGANVEGREHAQSLALAREIEAREAMSFLGVTNVWFLDGRDSATNNVLIALGVWPSGSVLEEIVRIMRLTRPEVVLTWLPSTVAGENHGDHQAAAVLTTEAFDMAGNPTVFPSQLAAPVRRYDSALEDMTPWQPKKLYYVSDAFDASFFHGHGPEYSANEISLSRKVSYLQLATQSIAFYYTQAPDAETYHTIAAGRDLAQMASKLEQVGYLDQVVRLWLGKTHVNGSATGDIFDGIDSKPIPFSRARPQAFSAPDETQAQLGGPWSFYHDFWREHELTSLLSLRPEISVRPNGTLQVPITITNSSGQEDEFTASAVLPPGWTQKEGVSVKVPAHTQASVTIEVVAPGQADKVFQEIRAQVTSVEKVFSAGSIFVKVVAP